jgi:SEC-C motif-containing protein
LPVLNFSAMPSASSAPQACPCGQPAPYAQCCGAYHQGLPAPDATALMRSRYSAFVQGLADYLLATWHPSTRPATLDLHEAGLKWLGLEVRHSQMLGPDTAVVEFVARSKQAGRAHRLHERSRFERIAGCWYYLDGDML